jgi:predicted HAD superfamily Cof-like phosphohydrolase
MTPIAATEQNDLMTGLALQAARMINASRHAIADSPHPDYFLAGMIVASWRAASPMGMLREFHEKFGLTAINAPTIPNEKDRKLRVELIREDFREFVEASEQLDIVAAADAIADLLYVVYGAAVTWGIPADECFLEVHRSNMTKVWSDGTVKRREDGKIMKPPTYSPAQLEPILWPEMMRHAD